MKKFGRWLMVFSLLTLCLICIPVLIHAQATNPSDPACDPLDPLCPIDGGIWFLLAVGIAYGIKKVKGFHKIGASQKSV